MLGVILRLLAAGDGDRGAGNSLKNLTTRWLVFGIAGIIFASGIAFGVLAGFWALESRTQNPVLSAVIMVGILILAALLIAFIAYGITGGEKTPGPAKAVAQALVPLPVEEVGRQIEAAAQEYGAVRVAAAAAAGGLRRRDAGEKVRPDLAPAAAPSTHYIWPGLPSAKCAFHQRPREHQLRAYTLAR